MPVGVRLDREYKLCVTPCTELAAYPESVNVLRDVHDDPRTSANLVNGVNDTDDARQMWLAPLMHNDINRIFLIFDAPTRVATAAPLVKTSRNKKRYFICIYYQ